MIFSMAFLTEGTEVSEVVTPTPLFSSKGLTTNLVYWLSNS